MEELKHSVIQYNKLRPNVVFNFVSVCKVSKINVKYVTCVCAKRGNQNLAKLRVCFIRVYVFASAATFNTVFCFTKIRWKVTELLGSKVLAETPCIFNEEL
jgi:hypothetical protein